MVSDESIKVIQNPPVSIHLCMFFSISKVNTRQNFLVLVRQFFSLLFKQERCPVLSTGKDPFYQYPKHCTMEDETLGVFGDLGEADQVFIAMEFT